MGHKIQPLFYTWRFQQPQRVSRHGHHPFDAAEGEEDQLLLELIVVRHVVQQVGLRWRQKRHHFLENGPVLRYIYIYNILYVYIYI